MTRLRVLAALVAAALLGLALGFALPPHGEPLEAASARWDAARWDASNWDASRWDASRWDASRWDGSRWDASNWDGSNWDASQWDASRWDASNWDASRWDASSWDASRWDGAFEGYDPLYAYQWGHRAVNVPGAWALVGAGSGDRVLCVLDSGVDHAHPDLAPQMWRDPATGAVGHDFVDDDADPMDPVGHGTHVASVAAARAGDGYGIAGVANARVMAVRVLGPDGVGTDEDLAAGIEWCADHGADVLSLSLRTDDRAKVVTKALKHAAGAGALVVASVGTGHCETCLSELADVPGVVAVTAVAPDGALAPFASWTKKTDLAAPGVLVPGAFAGGGWRLGSGASQAVPYVAGTAVLVWEAAPHLDAKDVARILADSAMETGRTSGQRVLVVDAEAAVLAALRA